MTKRIFMFAAIVFIFLFAKNIGSQGNHELAEDDKGSWLFHVCQATVRSMDAADGGTDADVPLSGRCIDYEEGVLDGVVSENPHAFCAGMASNGTMIRVYVNYMRQHPKLLDEAKSIGLIRSWIESYPCSKSHR
jgi:Rap1a immunity proteins